MSSASGCAPDISLTLQNVTNEIRQIQVLLTSENGIDHGIDPRILTDFRDAVNRVRNTAWAVEQYANSTVADADSRTLLSLLAGERVRVVYQLCRLVQADVANSEIKLQKGQLMHLRDATRELTRQLGEAVGD